MSRTVVTKSGRRLTEADIERLADQAERGFDLSTWKPRPGRPWLGAASRKVEPAAVAWVIDPPRNAALSGREGAAFMIEAPAFTGEVRVPTLLRMGAYRFHFHSREHDPPHVHVRSPDGSAVFELVPTRLRESDGYTRRQRAILRDIVTRHRKEFLRRWHEHFRQ